VHIRELTLERVVPGSVLPSALHVRASGIREERRSTEADPFLMKALGYSEVPQGAIELDYEFKSKDRELWLNAFRFGAPWCPDSCGKSTGASSGSLRMGLLGWFFTPIFQAPDRA
jgi:hypothetical protein